MPVEPGQAANYIAGIRSIGLGAGASEDPEDGQARAPDDAPTEDRRVALEIAPGIEWLCEPEMIGWRTSAAGYASPKDFPSKPSRR